MAGQVAVITGASSGIGEATALRLAREGVHVVLASRSGKVLKGIAAQCEESGVRTLVVEADMSREQDVITLAQKTIDHFGSFDIWINNAAVTSLGSFMQTPPEAFHKVMQTNFFGYVYGMRAALSHFMERGNGTVIDIASVFGDVPSPYESAYVASKFAIRGFDASVRQELALQEYKDIHVCTVLPSTIDTPIYRNAANYTGIEVEPVPPIYSATKVTNAITELIRTPRAEVIVGGSGRMVDILRHIVPTSLFDKIFAGYVQRTHFTNQPANVTSGNLVQPSSFTGISGQWPRAIISIPKTILITGAVVAGIGLVYMLSHGDGEDTDE